MPNDSLPGQAGRAVFRTRFATLKKNANTLETLKQQPVLGSKGALQFQLSSFKFFTLFGISIHFHHIKV